MNNNNLNNKYSIFCSSCGIEIVLKEDMFDNDLKCPFCKNYVHEKVLDKNKNFKRNSLIFTGILIGSLGLFLLGKSALEGVIIKNESNTVQIENVKSTDLNILLTSFLNDFLSDYAAVVSGENIDILDKYIVEKVKFGLARETNKVKGVSIKSLQFVAVKLENFTLDEDTNIISTDIRTIFNSVKSNDEIRTGIETTTSFYFDYNPSNNSILLNGFSVG